MHLADDGLQALIMCRQRHSGRAIFNSLRWLLCTVAACSSPVWSAQPEAHAALSVSGNLHVNIEPETMPRVDTYSSWKVRVDDIDGKPVDVSMAVRGGMPSHGHGLPSRPQVRRLDAGEFIVEGMLFNMPGLWVVIFDLQATVGASDSATYRLDVPF